MTSVTVNEAAKLLQRRLEELDFNLELTGRNGGRMRRFFSEASHGLEPTEEETKKREFQTRFLRTIVQQASQERVERLKQRMAVAETQSYESLIASQERLDALKELFAKMLDNAQQLPDGRRVFLSRTGEWAVDEHGEKLSDEEMAMVEWEVGRPSAEEALELQKSLDEAQSELDEISEFRGELATVQARIDSGEPLTVEEAKELELLLDDTADYQRGNQNAQRAADTKRPDYVSSNTAKELSLNNP